MFSKRSINKKKKKKKKKNNNNNNNSSELIFIFYAAYEYFLFFTEKSFQVKLVHFHGETTASKWYYLSSEKYGKKLQGPNISIFYN